MSRFIERVDAAYLDIVGPDDASPDARGYRSNRVDRPFDHRRDLDSSTAARERVVHPLDEALG
ncbi:MAG: hypothetical protein ACYTGP_13295, partial [Planctomycetota bacterium]